MSISIGELHGVISLNDQFSGPIDKVAKALGVSSKSFTAVAQFAGLAAGAIASAAGAITLLGVHGGKVASMEAAFDKLSGSVGETGAAMLAASQGATRGLISDFDLMAAANKAILLGLPVTAQSMGGLAQSAVVLGRAMGQDAKKSLDDLTTALGRSSPLILDNLGLTVKVGQANEAYAAQIGKSASQLTEAEKKTAFYNAAMDAAQKKVAELGGIHLTFADRVQQGRVMVTNFVDSLGKAIATSPVVAAGMDSIMEAIQGAFGSNSQDTVNALMGYVNQFAIFLVDAASVAVGAGRQISNIWNGLKVLFNEVVGFQINLLGDLVTSFGSLVEAATLIPGVGEKFKGLETSIKGIGTDLTNLGQGFRDQATEAVDAAGRQNAVFDSVQAVLGKTRDAMVAAQGATTQMATAAAMAAEQIAAMADASSKSGMFIWDMNTQILAKFVELQDQLTLANLSGLEQRLAEIEINREKEIGGLQEFAFANIAEYEKLVAMVNEKYTLMRDAAVGAQLTIAEAAKQAGFQTRAAMEETADRAKQLYDDMKVSGEFTYSELQRAHEEYKKKEAELNGTSAQLTVALFQTIASQVSTILVSLFYKNKTIAIGTAIIDTIAAAVAAFKHGGGWPLGALAAAATLAAGYAKVNQIRGQGFAEGTEGTRFENFGSGTATMLHGREAVVTETQADSVAGRVEAALMTRDAGMVDAVKENTSYLRAMRDETARERRLLPIMLRGVLQQARA